jgi:hypothetical protein
VSSYVEDDRKELRDQIARKICDSEAFMWLIVGADHAEMWLKLLREHYAPLYYEAGGGYGQYWKRMIKEEDSVT